MYSLVVMSAARNSSLRNDRNQLQPITGTNPFSVGEPIVTQDQSAPPDPTLNSTGQTVNTDCNALTVNGSDWRDCTTFGKFAATDPSPFRKFVGYGTITYKPYAADSIYNSLQVSIRRTIAPLTLSLTPHSHSLDSRTGRSANFVNSSIANRQFELRRTHRQLRLQHSLLPDGIASSISGWFGNILRNITLIPKRFSVSVQTTLSV